MNTVLLKYVNTAVTSVYFTKIYLRLFIVHMFEFASLIQFGY